MDLFFSNIDFNATVRDIDFTRIAVNKIHRVLNSEDFADMDVDKIFQFLFSEMEMVSFKDYLKRYIYERAALDMPFHSVPDQVYRDIILEAFEQNRAPHSFTPTSVKWKTAVKRWLEQENVQRSTIFLLGFGLRMSEDEVSDFLTKVIKEADFDFDDPWEVICWYCFRNQLPYAKAVKLQELYETLSVDGKWKLFHRENVTEKVLKDSCTEDNLKKYLEHLKKELMQTCRKAVRDKNFRELYQKAQMVVADLYQNDDSFEKKEGAGRPDFIGPADIEKILCDGIPHTPNGNLQKMSKSLLNRQFQQKRVTRQRLDALLKGNLEIERFDLISLQFLISSQDEEEDPNLRCRYFLDDINDILEECGMMRIYPVNPYEAFVLMCLLTEMPLLTYYDVWEMSYEEI